MRRLACFLVLAVAALAAAAGSAQAGGTLIRVHNPRGGNASPFFGPVFAADRLVWSGQVTNGRYHMTTLAVDGTDPSTRFIQTAARPHSALVSMALAASAGRLGVGLLVERCVGRCRTGRFAEPSVEFRAVLTAPLGEPLEALADSCTYAIPAHPSVDVSGDAVLETLCDGGLRVQDYAPSASPSGRELPDHHDGRIAGSILAAYEEAPPGPSNGDDLVVLDWRSGDELFRVPATGATAAGRVNDFDVRDDGTLVTLEYTATPGLLQLVWRSPADPTPHPFGDPIAGGQAHVRLAGDRVAFALLPARGGGRPVTYGVRTLAGDDVVSRSRPEGSWEFDFDGQRLAWATAPCGLGALAVWDLAGDPPRIQAGTCPFPRLVRGSGRIDKRRRFSVRLACPLEPALGCAGFLSSGPGNYRKFALDPGERTKLRLKVTPDDVACIDRHGRTRVRVGVTANKRKPGGGLRVKDRVVIAKGPRASAPDCGHSG